VLRAGAAILLFAFAIRAFGLDAQGLFNEEGYVVWLSRAGAERALAQTARVDSNTPLHYWLTGAWTQLAGASEFGARLLPAFAGLLTVALGAALARRVSPRSTAAVWAMLALAAWPAAIDLSREARMYALLACLAALSAILLFDGLRSNRRRVWAAWAAVMIALFATHVLGAILFGIEVAALAAWGVFRGRRAAWSARFPVVMAALAGAVIAAWSLAIVAVSIPASTTYAGSPNAWLLLQQSLASQLMPPLRAGEVAGAAIAAGALAAFALAAGAARSRALALMALACVAAVAVFAALTGKFGWRYAQMTVPLLAVAVGVAADNLLARMPAQPVRRLASIALGILMAGAGLLATAGWRGDPARANADFRGAARFLLEARAADEPILLTPDFSPVFEYYFGPGDWLPVPRMDVFDTRDTLDYDSAVPVLNQALAGKDGAWLLLYDETLMDPSRLIQALLRRQSQAFAPDLDTSEFNGLRLMHFRFIQPYQALPDRLPELSPRVEPGGVERGLRGLGCHQFTPARAGDPWMEVACFWQLAPGADVPPDTKVSLRLFDASGEQRLQADTVIAPFGLPYLAYDKPIASFYALQLPADAAPGEYTLRAFPYTESGEVAPRVATAIRIEERIR
jgi:hypothetical protein